MAAPAADASLQSTQAAPPPAPQRSAAPGVASPARSKASAGHVWLDRALDAHAGDPGRLPYATPAHPSPGKQPQLHRQALVVNLPPAAAHHTGTPPGGHALQWAARHASCPSCHMQPHQARGSQAACARTQDGRQAGLAACGAPWSAKPPGCQHEGLVGVPATATGSVAQGLGTAHGAWLHLGPAMGLPTCRPLGSGQAWVPTCPTLASHGVLDDEPGAGLLRGLAESSAHTQGRSPS